MLKLDQKTVMWMAAAVVLFAGAVLSVRNAGIYRRQSRLIESKTAACNEIDGMERARAGVYAALETIGQIPSGADIELNDILSGVDAAAEVERGGRENLPAGLVLGKSSVVFERIGAEALLRLIDSLEAQSPPWRVAGCSLQSRPGSAGMLRATLLLEQVEERR